MVYAAAEPAVQRRERACARGVAWKLLPDAGGDDARRGGWTQPGHGGTSASLPVLLRHSGRVPPVATEPLGDTVKHAPALIAAFLAAIALAGCGGPHTTTTAAAKARTSSPPPPAASAAASAAAAPSDTAPPDPWQSWCSSQAYVDDEDAAGDANASVQDVNSGDYATAATDGATLEVAALKAGSELPPAGNGAKLKYGLYFGGWRLSVRTLRQGTSLGKQRGREGRQVQARSAGGGREVHRVGD